MDKKIYPKIPLIILVVSILFLFGKTLILPEGKIIYGGDINDAYYYWKNYLRVSFRSGTIPFWNPYNFSGTPFLAHPDINFFYPPNWLFVILPLNWSFAWYFFIHLVIAGFTMYWFLKKRTDAYGALGGAICYALGGFFVGRIYSGHLEYVDAASWVPLAFGLSIDSVTSCKIKDIIKAITALSILIVCGNELFLLFTLELVSLYIVFLFIRHFKKAQKLSFITGKFVILMIIIVSSVLLSAFEFIPRYQFISNSLRSQGIPYELARTGSLPFSGLILFLNPLHWGLSFHDKYTYSGPWPNLFEYQYYVGIVPVLILFAVLISPLIGKIKKIKYRMDITGDIWFYTLIAIPFFLMISFGVNFPINLHEILWKYIPLYQGIRFPARHLFAVALSLSIICGLYIGTLKNKKFKAILIIFMLANLLAFGKQFVQITDVPSATLNQDLIGFLSSDKSLFRVLPDFTVVSPVRRDLDFGASSMYKIQTTSDYNSMILWNYYRFIDIMNNSRISSISYFNVEIPPLSPNSPYIGFLNAKYLLSDKSYDRGINSLSDRYKLIKDNERYKLFENNKYLPRFFFVGNIENYKTKSEIEEAFFQKEIDLSDRVLLLNANINSYDFSCANKPRGNINLISYETNQIILDTDSDCNNILSTSEVFYPGWKAEVDGRKTDIFVGNYAFRSMYIPKGKHHLKIFYSLDIYIIGFVISLLAVTGLVIVYKKYKNEKIL